MEHPVPQGFECIWCQLSPDDWNLPIEEGASHLIQLAAHANLSRQRLMNTERYNKALYSIPSRSPEQFQIKKKQHVLVVFSDSGQYESDINISVCTL